MNSILQDQPTEVLPLPNSWERVNLPAPMEPAPDTSWVATCQVCDLYVGRHRRGRWHR